MTRPADVASSIRDSAARKLLKVMEKVQKAGIEVEMHLAEASPSEAIAKFAGRTAADLIVMATHGRTGVKHALLGSVAERTLRSVSCPVMTVKERRDDWAALRLCRIVVPTDFSPPAQRALDVARDLAASCGPCEVLLVHAYTVPLGLATYLKRGSQGIGDEITRGAREDLERLVKKMVDDGVTASFSLRQGRPDEVIVEAARRQGADMIVMGTHGRSGLPHVILGSVAERVVRTSPCPTVTVRS